MDVQHFNYEDKKVRTIDRDGQTWFVAVDIERITGHDRVRDTISKCLDPDEADNIRLADQTGRLNHTLIINESGFYKLMFRSRLPQAKAFTKFVTSVILPAIRRTGHYNPNGQLYADVLQFKEREKELTVKRNEINKELRFIKLQIEQTESLIYAPYKHIHIENQMELPFDDSELPT